LGESTTTQRGVFVDQKREKKENTLARAAAVGFLETLPLSKSISDDLHRWITMETFEGSEVLFRYHLSDDEYRTFAREFASRKNQYLGHARL
jgi:hypothetical protein